MIPNSRQKTSRTIGGQPGHAKKKLEAFHEEEITENVLHKEENCPYCGGEAEETGNTCYKDELDYEVVVIKRRHHFPECRCKVCGKRFRESIPEELKEENQYGSRVKALCFALMNTGNVSVSKVRRMLYGLSEEEINPSEGYIIKLQKKAAKMPAYRSSEFGYPKHCAYLCHVKAETPQSIVWQDLPTRTSLHQKMKRVLSGQENDLSTKKNK